ncbi:MAG: hypothetical protein ACRDTW_18025 [Rhodococcus qingshengii]
MVHILPAAPLGTTDQMSPIRAADPNGPRPASADVALAVAAATVLGVTVGVLLGDVVAGVAVGSLYRGGVPLRVADDHHPKMTCCAGQRHGIGLRIVSL